MIPYTLVAQGIYSGVITTISSLTIGTCKIITSIYGHKNENVDLYIKKLDIERKLCVIESVLNSYNTNSIHSAIKKSNSGHIITDDLVIEDYVRDKERDPIKICLHYISINLNEIHTILDNIHKKVAYHKSKWFNSWRQLNIRKNLEELETSVGLLDDRFDSFIKISGFLSDQKN